MKTKRRPVAVALLISVLLATFGSGFTSDAASRTVTTGSELAYDPLAQTASIAYEQHEDGYAVSLDRAEDSVTMNITAVPDGEGSRAAEKARLYIHTGVELRPGISYRVSFSLWAEREQPEYAVCFDGASAAAAYGTLDGRSIKAGGTDQVNYQVTPEAANGELVLRLLLGKTEAAGNKLRLSNLSVEEAPANVTGENVVLVDSLDYNTPGFIRLSTNADSGAVIDCDGESATLTVTKEPTQGAEVWKIKMLVATGLKPEAGKTYRFTADVDSTAKRDFELCYNEDDTEKGFGAEYSQRLTGNGQKLNYLIHIPGDKNNAGELILQFSLGMMKTGEKFTISNIFIEEAASSYRDELADFSFDTGTSVSASGTYIRVLDSAEVPTPVNWDGKATVSASGDFIDGDPTVSGGSATLKIKFGSTNPWDARFNIDTGEDLKAGKTYRVGFNIQVHSSYSDCEVLYGTGFKANGIDNNEAYGSIKGLVLEGSTFDAAPKNAVSYMITPEADGKLLISLQVGKTDGRSNSVTVSDFKIEEMVAGVPSDKSIADVNYPSKGGSAPTPSLTPGSFRVRDNIGELSGDGRSATITCAAQGDKHEAWERGLFIDDICTLEDGSSYKVSFEIMATKDTAYEVAYNRDEDWGDGHENAFGHENDLTASTQWTTHEHTIDAAADGKLRLRLDLGLAEEGTKISVRNITVEKLDGGSAGPSIQAESGSVADFDNYPSTEYGAFYIRKDGNGDGVITGDGKSASMVCTGGIGDIWHRGFFVKNVCKLNEGSKYRISFDIEADAKTDYQVAFLREAEYDVGFNPDGGTYDFNGKNTDDDSHFSEEITANSTGRLWLRIEFGKADTGTKVTVKNITVEEIEDGESSDDIAGFDNYPSTEYGAFYIRKDGNGDGVITGDGESATMVCTGGIGDIWPRGFFVEDVCELNEGSNYRVSFDIDADAETDYQVAFLKEAEYNNGFNPDGGTYDFSGKNTADDFHFSEEITANSTGRLWLRIEFGKADTGTKVTVSNITVEKIEGEGSGGGDFSFSVTYPSVSSGSGSGPNSGSFSVRDGKGTITGDGSSATMTCPAQEPTPEAYQHGLFTGTIAKLEAGKSYSVSFKISADRETPFEVCYNKDGDWGDGHEKGFGGKYGMKASAAEQTVEYNVHATGDNALSLRIDLGLAQEGATVTVSDIQVREVGYAPVGSPVEISSFGSVWAESGDGFTAELTKNSDNAVLKVTKSESAESGNWQAKLFIRTGLTYDANKAYRAKFDITATNEQKEFCVISRGVADEKDIRGTWGLKIAAGETRTIVTRPIPAGEGTGDFILQLELGNLDGTENTFTVSNLTVEEVDLDVTYDYLYDPPNLTAKSASLHITQTPSYAPRMEAWMLKMFLNNAAYVVKDEAVRVTFDLRSTHDMDFEVCYNRVRIDGEKVVLNDDGEEESGESEYGSFTNLHAEGGKTKSVEFLFTASKTGWLTVQLMLGLAEAPNTVTVSNLRVDKVTNSYSGGSALPAEVDYRTPSAVSYWSHEDYTTTFTGSDSAITANIEQAPQSGAEPWKIKLFLDTGTPLQAGKYYKVTADVIADLSQDFEVCYNNGGVEMGYDSMGGLHLVGGKAQTVEKIISVPADKASTDNLMLQFNLGRTTRANAVTVSGVKVEEVPLSYADMMSKDFAYTGSGVDLWTNTDYTATLEGSGSAATVHITGVPSTGAEVWKVKMLINTGAILSAGKTYLVRADILAAKGQNYEVCFNNEETEKGFDALYGQTITAGSKATVEKTISVPESMTDAGELVLQFSVGDAVENDITVSNVSVQELDFGMSAGSPAPDTVVNLYNAPQTAAGTLDVTRDKLTYKIAKISSEAADNTITIAGANLKASDLYTVTFTARANKDLTGTFALSQAGGGTAAISEQFRLTPKATAYSFTTKDPLSSGGFYDLLWQFGCADNQQLGSADVEISNISVYSPAENLEIMRSWQNVTVNGEAVTPDVYSINGYNYFKLRDLAVLLSDTDAQFVVRYNEKDNSVSLTTNKPYTPVGGEMTVGENQSESCARSSQDIVVNGKTVNLKVYNIGGNNFFGLRDFSDLLGFTVEYIAESDTVAITSPLTPEAQEKAHDYDIFFLPEVDGEAQPYVGDTMPYYEDGVYYIYYLKDGGDSYNHSVYLTTTTDFVRYTEYDDPVLSASREDVQDNWIGTGSVVKVDNTYYLFYTGYNASGSQEYHEKIMVAKGSSPTSFEKVSGWEIIPPDELGQKNDFRDPQAYYDPASRTISLTVTASQGGAARILKYTLDKDLRNARYDGIIFTDPTGAFWNLECSDTFQIGNKWYLTYSGQEDTLWYAMADSRFGPYTNPARLEGKLFYAAKHVEDGTNSYMVGWARRANSASSTEEVSGWAGNIAVQKLRQLQDGTLALVPVDSIMASFGTQRELALGASETTVAAGSGYSFTEAFTSYESFMLSGEFTYSGTGSFGLAFDFNGKEEQYKLVSVDPAENKIKLSFNEGTTPITEAQAALSPNQTHSFTYIQDGSVGIFYLDDQAALLVRLYGVTDKPIYLFAENNSVTFTSLQQYTQ